VVRLALQNLICGLCGELPLIRGEMKDPAVTSNKKCLGRFNIATFLHLTELVYHVKLTTV
jgi:hypothetical protein